MKLTALSLNFAPELKAAAKIELHFSEYQGLRPFSFTALTASVYMEFVYPLCGWAWLGT